MSQRTPDQQNQAYEDYLRRQEERDKRTLSNTQAHDRAIITLSSASIGAALITLRDKVSVGSATTMFWAALAGFVTALVVTLASFHTSQKAMAIASERDRVSMETGEPADFSSNFPDTLTGILNVLGSVSYVVGIVLLALALQQSQSPA